MLTVRIASPDEVDDVVAVGHRTWPPTYVPIAGADYVREGLAKWWTRGACLPAIVDGRTLVAVDDDSRVVGMASWSTDGDVLTLWKLYVLPEDQGRGIGRALMGGVIDEARRASVSNIRLAFLDGNDSARGFYEARGFRVVHTERGGLDGPDNVWMERPVRPAPSTDRNGSGARGRSSSPTP